MFVDEGKLLARKKEMLEFINRHANNYQEMEVEALRNVLAIPEFYRSSVVKNAVIAQVLAKFEVLKPEVVTYDYFIDLLEAYNFLEGNCLEVGAGYYPILAEKILKRGLTNRINLTIYEPKIFNIDLEKVIIKKEKFTKETKIDNYKTLFGLFPCEATIPLTEKALEEDKNLLVALCQCDHTTEKYKKKTQYWADDFAKQIKEEYKDVEIIHFPERFEIPYPILVHKSKNKTKNLVAKNHI